MNDRRVELDVRPVPPKDRFDLIIGTYHSLEPDQVLDLTVDHDPECMYYTLKATEGDDAFRFEYLERGPINWRVEVRKSAGAAPVQSAPLVAEPVGRSG